MSFLNDCFFEQPYWKVGAIIKMKIKCFIIRILKVLINENIFLTATTVKTGRVSYWYLIDIDFTSSYEIAKSTYFELSILVIIKSFG